jgi:hypothetical protein
MIYIRNLIWNLSNYSTLVWCYANACQAETRLAPHAWASQLVRPTDPKWRGAARWADGPVSCGPSVAVHALDFWPLMGAAGYRRLDFVEWREYLWGFVAVGLWWNGRSIKLNGGYLF